ncbi:VOC family protein [Novosphingobium colocasiae]
MVSPISPIFAKNVAGVDHVAFSMPDLNDLVAAYKRLKSAGMTPTYSINHGPTTSLYYTDPDGVMVELQVDNIAFPGGARAFFDSKEFTENPIGVFF